MDYGKRTSWSGPWRGEADGRGGEKNKFLVDSFQAKWDTNPRMNKLLVYIATGIIGLLGVQLEAWGTGTLIPFSDDFDGYNMGLFTGSGTDWTTNGTGSALITNSPAPAAGILMCSASDMNLTLAVDQTKNYTNVIWSFMTQPVRYEDEGGTAPPTNFTGAAAAFYVDTNGVVKAYRFTGVSNDWLSISGAGAVPTNQWVGFSIRIQYAPSASNYYVSMTTGGVTTTLNSGNPIAIPVGAPSMLSDVAVYNSYNLDLVSLSMPPTPPGSIGLPFFDGFENYFTSGTRMGPLTNDPTARVYWSLSGGDDASAIVTNVPSAIELTRQCRMTNANLTLNVDAGRGYSNIWCQMYIRPVGYEDDGGASAPSVAAGAAAAVYVDTNGYLKAYAYVGDSNAWSNLVYVSTSVWVGVAMHVDYVGRKWEVFYTTNGYGTPMTNASSNALDIQTNATSVSTIGQVVIQNNADLDAVGLSQGTRP